MPRNTFEPPNEAGRPVNPVHPEDSPGTPAGTPSAPSEGATAEQPHREGDRPRGDFAHSRRRRTLRSLRRRRNAKRNLERP